ncbi:hypothetical protein BTO02_33515 [Paraburkholderia sp. SOS3]|nr:hypothetical protein BTO02_33515 [Paraburkholderia sp. SOS3]
MSPLPATSTASGQEEKDPVARPGLIADWPTYYTKSGLPGLLRVPYETPGSPACRWRPDRFASPNEAEAAGG